MRWPLYVVEFGLCLIAIIATIVVWVKRGPGWKQNIFILSACIVEIVIASIWGEQAIRVGGDFLPSPKWATLGHIPLVAWPLALLVIMVSRLWKPGK